MSATTIGILLGLASCTVAAPAPTHNLPADLRASLVTSAEYLGVCLPHVPSGGFSSGKPRLSFTVGKNGFPTSVSVDGAGNPPALTKCLTSAAAKIPVPKGDAGRKVSIELLATAVNKSFLIRLFLSVTPEELDSACYKSGIPHVCNMLGSWRNVGLFPDPKSNKGRREYERACELGMTNSCANAASTYFKKDDERAASLMWKSCDAGDVDNCEMGYIITSEGPDFSALAKKLPDWATKFAKRGCSLGKKELCGK